MFVSFTLQICIVRKCIYFGNSFANQHAFTFHVSIGEDVQPTAAQESNPGVVMFRNHNL